MTNNLLKDGAFFGYIALRIPPGSAKWAKNDLHDWPSLVYEDLVDYLILKKAFDGKEIRVHVESRWLSYVYNHCGEHGTHFLKQTASLSQPGDGQKDYQARAAVSEADSTVLTGDHTCPAGAGKHEVIYQHAIAQMSVPNASTPTSITTATMTAIAEPDVSSLSTDSNADVVIAGLSLLKRRKTDLEAGHTKIKPSQLTTSELESFNNHLLIYSPKRNAFSYAVYKCRCQLSAIEYTKHLHRTRVVYKDGNPKWRGTYSKAVSNWTVHPIKEAKEYSYIPGLQLKIAELFCAREDPLKTKVTLGNQDPKRIRTHIAPVSPKARTLLAENLVKN